MPFLVKKYSDEVIILLIAIILALVVILVSDVHRARLVKEMNELIHKN